MNVFCERVDKPLHWRGPFVLLLAILPFSGISSGSIFRGLCVVYLAFHISVILIWAMVWFTDRNLFLLSKSLLPTLSLILTFSVCTGIQGLAYSCKISSNQNPCENLSFNLLILKWKSNWNIFFPRDLALGDLHQRSRLKLKIWLDKYYYILVENFRVTGFFAGQNNTAVYGTCHMSQKWFRTSSVPKSVLHIYSFWGSTSCSSHIIFSLVPTIFHCSIVHVGALFTIY